MTYLNDKMVEECGVFGIYAPGEEAARLAYFALFSLQHRGQESAGIATSDNENLHILKGLGLVSQVFDEASLETLKGEIAIGHNRYSTTGSNHDHNASPILQDCELGTFAVAHNGNLVNTYRLKRKLQDNFEFETTTDSEILAKLIAQSKGKNF
ncbi:MAG: class II glutamine amidotransferase, partial [Patescibacteria group bacterium]|nr:class II glutamine amidotransferase [Patescibacteria group bacterium]